jgi:hypothetical protein
VTFDKHQPETRHKLRRERSEIAKDMQAVAQAAASELGISFDTMAAQAVSCSNIIGSDAGLILADLEKNRWGVSSKTAKTKLIEAKLPHGGRSAKLIYSWASIFRAEGIAAEVASMATRLSHPELFDDLLDGAAAARFIGVGSESAVRKLVLSGEIPPTAYVMFGSRPFRRFRPSLLTLARISRLQGRLV